MRVEAPFLKLSNFRIPRHLGNHLGDPTFYHFFKNHIFWPKKANKTRFLKFLKILGLLNGYLGDTRPSNYLILKEGALNFHLKSNSSFYHFFRGFIHFCQKTLCETAEDCLFNCNQNLKLEKADYCRGGGIR